MKLSWSVAATIAITAQAVSLATLSAVLWNNWIEYRKFQTFHNKHVWVTGGSQGIGEQVVVDLLTRYHVKKLTVSSRKKGSKWVPYLEDPTLLENEISSENARSSKFGFRNINSFLARSWIRRVYRDELRNTPQLHFIPLDLSVNEYATLQEAYQEAITLDSGTNHVDILILNAGINNQGLFFSELPPSLINQVVQVNLTSTIQLIHVCLPRMIERNQGVIAIVGSMAGYRGLPHGTVYNSTKSALQVFIESLRIELYHTNVVCTILNPGFILTPATKDLTHPKPFEISVEECSNEILYGITVRKRSYGFPWIMEHIVLGFSCLVPSFLYEPIMARV